MKKLLTLAAILLTSVVATLAGPPAHTGAAPQYTYVVNSNGDDGDQNVGDHICADASGYCTLRAAIQEANATIGLDEIDFDIIHDAPTTCIYDLFNPPVTPPITAICPTYTLPTISAPVIIDGTKYGDAPGGYSPGTVELDGANGGGIGAGAGVDALLITAGGSTVKGLWILGWGRYGIDLRTFGGNTIQANWIGDVDDASADLGNDPWVPNTNDGVYIDNVPNNLIGGTEDKDRNVISGNGGVGSPSSPGYGVTISGSSATGNIVEGNYVGTDVTGAKDEGNNKSGVYINGAPNNTVGGTTSTTPGGPCTGSCNVISGNTSNGVEITGAAATGNVVYGNFIGTTANGLVARGNSSNGVYINGASNNTIGGTSASARNVISKNYSSGVSINGSSSAGNIVQGNYIGTDATGAVALGNSGNGVTIASATGSTIGGTAAGARNIISGNSQSGVAISGSSGSGNVVEGNYVGTGVTGEKDVHNMSNGIYISGAPNNTIGGTTVAARNVIAFNGFNSSNPPSCSSTTNAGVSINASGAKNNLVEGNFIGVTPLGALAGNCVDGVRVNAAPTNVVGGSAAGAGNLIMYQYHGAGVNIMASGAHDNVVRGNRIWGNVDGVYINGAPTNTIGGTSAGEGNLISGNGRGVTIFNPIGVSTATGNLVQGNFIGTDPTGTVAGPQWGNSSDGVFISSSAGNAVGGTVGTTPGGPCSGACNVISGNGAVGVEIYDVPSASNHVQGNFIGTDIGGTVALGNSADGIFINNAPSNIVGGTSASARNIISGNHNSGVYISGAGAANNAIQGNHIGTDTAGTGDLLGNAYDGVRVGAFSSGTSVGGTLAGAGNIIAYNGGDGVMVDRSVNNGILGNSIFSNAGIPANPVTDPPLSYGLGIDLVSAGEGAGVTLNDAQDPDIGGNNYQNFPVLTQAVSTGGNTTIQGTFNSTPGTNNFRLEFFSNSSCNQPPTGYPSDSIYGPWDYGEGQTYLGSTTVNTDADGNATVNVVLPTGLAQGLFITATATDPSNNTSEFSQCLEVTVVNCAYDVDGDDDIDIRDVQLVFAHWPSPPLTYNATYDVDADGDIDIRDVQLVFAHWPSPPRTYCQ